MSENKTIIICHGWSVGFNPFGDGLILYVDRGISCEMHTQVFSAHTTNTPSFEYVKAVIDSRKDEFVQAIDTFVDFLRSFPKMGLCQDWNIKEMFAAMFSQYLIREIARDAESHMWQQP